nr:protein UPSTREAM OF FLC [Ipomoea batatas]
MELYTSKRWKHAAAENSPERTRVWTEPPNGKPKSERKVAVVYYLSRNGQLEHPHFMEVPLSSPEGLYLRDVINRLNFLRGIGLASLYSWSAKRSLFIMSYSLLFNNYIRFKFVIVGNSENFENLQELQEWICVARFVGE